MYVRMLTGRYKGDIREASPTAARAMLADGRAERVYPEVDAAPAEPALEPPASSAEAVATQVEAVAVQPTKQPVQQQVRKRRRR